MAKQQKYVLIPGNPRVEKREVKNNRYSLVLVYTLHDGTRKKKAMGLHIHKTPQNAIERKENNDVIDVAKAIRAEKEKQFLSDTKGYKFKVQPDKVDFIEWLGDYVDIYKADHAGWRKADKAKRDFEKYTKTLRKSKTTTATITAAMVNDDVVSGFVKYLEMHSKGTGAATTFKIFKAMITAATKEGLFKTNPCEGVKVYEVEGRITKDILTADEVKQLIECKYDGLNEDGRRAFTFSLFTGLRWCDVKGLKYSNIDYENKVVMVEQAKVKGHSKQSVVYNPLTQSIIDMIGKGDPGELLFPKLQTTNEGANAMLREWAKRAGIKKHITWHCARHTFGTIIVNKTGADIITAKSLLGHGKIENTQAYTHALSDSKRAAVEGLEKAIQAATEPHDTAAQSTDLDSIIKGLSEEDKRKLIMKLLQ